MIPGKKLAWQIAYSKLSKIDIISFSTFRPFIAPEYNMYAHCNVNFK